MNDDSETNVVNSFVPAPEHLAHRWLLKIKTPTQHAILKKKKKLKMTTQGAGAATIYVN